MALHGEWIGVTSTQPGKGDSMLYVMEIMYNGKPWKMSTFQPEIQEVADGLEEGEAVAFETKKSGKYTNITMLEKSDGSTPKKAATSQKKGAGQVSSGYRKDTRDEVLGKTLTQLVNGFCSGGKIPDDKDMFQLAILAKHIADGTYFKEKEQDGELF